VAQEVPAEGEGQQRADQPAEAEEARRPRIALSPKTPSRDEIEEHNATHLPYRNWCPHCIRGRSENAPHQALGEQGEAGVPLISMDYSFLGRSAEERAEQDRGGLHPVLVYHDARSSGLYAHLLANKGVDVRTAKLVVTNLDRLGYKRIVLRTDQEPAMISLADQIAELWKGEIVPERSPAGESQSNGAAERAVKSMMGHIRTLHDALETRLGGKVAVDHPLMSWLVDYAATVWRRFHVGQDGRTAYERVKGRRSHQRVYEFGEIVWFRPLTPGWNPVSSWASRTQPESTLSSTARSWLCRGT
jgi:hypothetical protein